MLDIYTNDGLRGQAKLPILATLVGSKDSHFPNSDKFLWVYFLLQWDFFPKLPPGPLPSNLLRTPYYI